MADASEKRRFPRVSVTERMDGEVRPSIQGSVVNLSLGGVCIEHREVIPPGCACDVALRERGGAGLSLRGKIVWTSVERVEKRGRDRTLIYQSGLEFVDVTAEQTALLQRILKGGRWGGQGALHQVIVFLTFT